MGVALVAVGVALFVGMFWAGGVWLALRAFENDLNVPTTTNDSGSDV